MPGLVEELRGGDPKSLGRSAEVAAKVVADPSLLDELFDGLADPDRPVRARCADAIEKVVAARPDIIHPHKETVLRWMTAVTDWTVRSHVCQLLPRLKLSPGERREMFEVVRGYLDDRSSIVRTFAMQTMFDFASHDASLLPDTMDVLERATTHGSAAMKARARILLKRSRARAITKPR